MGLLSQLIAPLKQGLTKQVIILGTDYPEYQLYKQLLAKNVKVPFFISEDPWKHRSKIEQATCYYPYELPALCKNHGINTVMYCDDTWLDKIPSLENVKLQLADK